VASEPKSLGDLPALRAVTHPLRFQLLDLLDQRPMSVKELAGRLDLPRNKLHYHVNILERHGVVRIASADGGERRYEPTGRSFEFDRKKLAPSVVTAVSGILEGAARDLGDQLRREVKGPTSVGRRRVRVTKENHAEFLAKLRALTDEYDDDGADTVFVFAVYEEPPR
jgi:DNA-binding transcriptional ArsR family regulator